MADLVFPLSSGKDKQKNKINYLVKSSLPRLPREIDEVTVRAYFTGVGPADGTGARPAVPSSIFTPLNLSVSFV